MVRVKPFCGIRPPKEFASEVASRPYDVLDSAEAKAEATERSLLHIIKAEIDFDPVADEHSQAVYDKAVENFRAWKERGWLAQDDEEHYYVYAQTMEGRTQYGIAMCCHFEDYVSGAPSYRKRSPRTIPTTTSRRPTVSGTAYGSSAMPPRTDG